MEPKGSLPHLQGPATCSYLEPARSSPYTHITLHEDPFNIILPSTPGSTKWSLSLRFPYQNPVYASPLPHTRYMPRQSHTNNDHCFKLSIDWMVRQSNSGRGQETFPSPELSRPALGPPRVLGFLPSDRTAEAGSWLLTSSTNMARISIQSVAPPIRPKHTHYCVFWLNERTC
jgi:hypothetical protein